MDHTKALSELRFCRDRESNRTQGIKNRIDDEEVALGKAKFDLKENLEAVASLDASIKRLEADQ